MAGMEMELTPSRRKTRDLILEIFDSVFDKHGFEARSLTERAQPHDPFGCNLVYVNSERGLLVLIACSAFPDTPKSGTSLSIGKGVSERDYRAAVNIEDFLEALSRGGDQAAKEVGDGLKRAYQDITDEMPPGEEPNYTRRCLEYYVPALESPALQGFLSGRLPAEKWEQALAEMQRIIAERASWPSPL